MLGGAAQTIDKLIEEMGEGQIAQCPAAVFGDESKAFERVSLMWLNMIMLRWGFTAWARNAIMDWSYPRWSDKRGSADWGHGGA